MTGNDLPNADHVVRYIRPSSVRENGKINGREFCLRQNETGLSVCIHAKLRMVDSRFRGNDGWGSGNTGVLRSLETPS